MVRSPGAAACERGRRRWRRGGGRARAGPGQGCGRLARSAAPAGRSSRRPQRSQRGASFRKAALAAQLPPAPSEKKPAPRAEAGRQACARCTPAAALHVDRAHSSAGLSIPISRAFSASTLAASPVYSNGSVPSSSLSSKRGRTRSHGELLGRRALASVAGVGAMGWRRRRPHPATHTRSHGLPLWAGAVQGAVRPGARAAGQIFLRPA